MLATDDFNKLVNELQPVIEHARRNSYGKQIMAVSPAEMKRLVAEAKRVDEVHELQAFMRKWNRTNTFAGRKEDAPS